MHYKRVNSHDAYLRLLSIETELTLESWSASDLREILDHQLAADLSEDLIGSFIERPLASHGDGALRQTLLGSFADVLRASSPPPELLCAIKDWAKSVKRPGQAYPAEAADYLYVLAVCKACSCGLEGVSTLSAETRAREAARCLTLMWPSEAARALLRTLLPVTKKSSATSAIGARNSR